MIIDEREYKKYQVQRRVDCLHHLRRNRLMVGSDYGVENPQ